MAENTTIRTPYNFVPFSNKVLRYPEGRALPRHDAIDLSLLTGEIHVTLTAETPVFVSDGGKENAHFFRDTSGRYAIPGSSLRGLIRENMQILSFGLARPGEDFLDYQIFFREVAPAKDSTGGPLKEYYHTVLGVETRKTDSGKSFSAPKNVQAGYLCREGSNYCIRPVRGTCLRVSRKHPGLRGQGETMFTQTCPVAYTDDGQGNVKELRMSEDVPSGMKRGVLLFTGKAVGKSNHAYLFPEADPNLDAVRVPSEDVLSYREDLEKRANSLKGANMKGQKLNYSRSFWELPKADEEKPVFYLMHDGHIYFGMALFLRIGYSHPLSAGLQDRQKELLCALSEDDMFLDYPHAILGCARKNMSYRSRVSFGDLVAEGEPQALEPFKTVLGEPKPSWYPGYTVDGKHYNEDFRLRGYKQYWLKKAEHMATDKDNAASTLRPLPAGTGFRGVIRYKNLYPDELGLLLWALRLEDGCYQSLGMGKPYGFGRMKLSIDSLRQFDFRVLYTPDGLCSGPKEDTVAVDGYIANYIARAEQELNLKKEKGLRQRPELLAFFYLRSVIRENEDVRYMNLDAKEYQNVTGTLPDVARVKKENEERKDVTKEPESLSLAEQMARLKATINQRRL